MQTRLNLYLLFSIGFCGLSLCFPSTVLRAEETPGPLGTRGATAGIITPTPPPVAFTTPAMSGAAAIAPTPSPIVPPSVRAVGVHNWRGGEQRHVYLTYAKRGD